MTNVTHNSFLYIYFYFVTLYMFRVHHVHHQERQIVSTQLLVTVTLFTVGGHVVCRSEVHCHRHRLTVIRSCVDTVCLSWWWARCARNMWRDKNKNKYMIKNCASRCSFTKNHNMTHGQQNVKKKKSLKDLAKRDVELSYLDRIVHNVWLLLTPWCTCSLRRCPWELLPGTEKNTRDYRVHSQ
jgi:hypothetical protein